MFNCWVFRSANSVTRPDRDNQYNMRIVYQPLYLSPRGLKRCISCHNFSLEMIGESITIDDWFDKLFSLCLLHLPLTCNIFSLFGNFSVDIVLLWTCDSVNFKIVIDTTFDLILTVQPVKINIIIFVLGTFCWMSINYCFVTRVYFI